MDRVGTLWQIPRGPPRRDKASLSVTGSEKAGEPPSPEADQLILEFKRRHYADWPDQPLPALDGKTPREAVQTVGGRGVVDVLLKGMENLEQRAGGAELRFLATQE